MEVKVAVHVPLKRPVLSDSASLQAAAEAAFAESPESLHRTIQLQEHRVFDIAAVQSIQ